MQLEQIIITESDASSFIATKSILGVRQYWQYISVLNISTDVSSNN